MKNGRAKGKRAELELAHVLRDYGYDTRRGQQYCGANGDADVVGLPGVHIECKRVERLNLEDAIAQAQRDARQGEIPVVMHRRNRGQWLVTEERPGACIGCGHEHNCRRDGCAVLRKISRIVEKGITK